MPPYFYVISLYQRPERPLRPRAANHRSSFITHRLVAPSSWNDEGNRKLSQSAMTPQNDRLPYAVRPVSDKVTNVRSDGPELLG